MADPLSDVLARMRQDARTYKEAGDRLPPDVLARYANAVEASEDAALLAWVPEARAVDRSAHDVRYFKRRRAEWQAAGVARATPRGWEYRSCVVPQRTDVGESSAAEADRLLGRVAA